MRLPATITAPEHIDGLTPSRIDPTNMGLAMEFFAAIYSRPRDAVLRELAANGVDAQQSNGYDGPVQVTLPTDEYPYLIVTDHGVGMDESLLTHVFADYLESTKRESCTAIGGYGVGGKTPAAVSDQFTVTSTHRGITVTTLMAKQPDGTTGHKIITRKKTGHQSGTTVTVPLAPPAHDAWADAAKRVFYWWEPGRVSVDGQTPSTFHQSVNADVSTNRVSYIDGRYQEALLRINGVGYQIPDSMVRAAGITYANLIIEAGDGSALTISRSRETVDDTDEGRQWLREVYKHWLKIITRRTKSRLARAATSVEVATVWARIPRALRPTLSDHYGLSSLLESRGLPLHLENRATVYAAGKRNRATDAKFLMPSKHGFSQSNIAGYLTIANGVFIAPTEFTDEVAKVISRWRKGPGRSTTLTVVDPATPDFDRLLAVDRIRWITGAEIIEQAPPAVRRKRDKSPFSIKRIDLTNGWQYRGQYLGLDELKELDREGYNLVVGNRDDVQTMKRSLDPDTDAALLRGSRSLERIQELVGSQVYTPEQIITKHADDGLYEMSTAARQSLSNLLSLQLGWNTKRSLVGIRDDAELSRSARRLLAPWAKHLNGPARNQVDYRAGSTLPQATIRVQYPLTARMLCSAETVDVQVLNALVELDEAN